MYDALYETVLYAVRTCLHCSASGFEYHYNRYAQSNKGPAQLAVSIAGSHFVKQEAMQSCSKAVGMHVQALWYYCQPPLASLQHLASIASDAAVGKLRGSALLNLLFQRSASVAGDEQARKLLQKLLHASCAPYFR